MQIGDDLRQDALTMQLIRVIERMWLAEGLNLKIVTYDCLPTDNNTGNIFNFVPNCNYYIFKSPYLYDNFLK